MVITLTVLVQLNGWQRNCECAVRLVHKHCHLTTSTFGAECAKMADWPADQPAIAGVEYLVSGAVLEPGQFLKSTNDLSRAILQTDGNLVVWFRIFPFMFLPWNIAYPFIELSEPQASVYGARGALRSLHGASGRITIRF